MINSKYIGAAWYDLWATDPYQRVEIYCPTATDMRNARRKVLSAANIRNHILQTTKISEDILVVEFVGRLGEKKTCAK